MNVVTGAFSFTGKYIAKQLLEIGEEVKTITGHPDRNLFNGRIKAFPFNFDNSDKLTKTLEGTTTLYNTYWIRIPYKCITFNDAVKNSITLFKCAKAAGVRRIVHISVTNASINSTLPYFRAKAKVEEAIKDSSISFAIIRPTVIFGDEDILFNNIAYFLRTQPVFAIPGKGKFRIQPVYVEDVAKIAVDAGHQDTNLIIDAAGPEIFAYEDLILLMVKTLKSKTKIFHSPALILFFVSKIMGYFYDDVILTKKEIDGLMSEKLISYEPPRGTKKFSDWFSENFERTGLRYISDLKRHFR